MIRVVLPQHLRTLAQINKEVELQISGPVTLGSVLANLESQYPVLVGTILDNYTHQRRPFIRFFACGQDFSLESWDTSLPDEIATGKEPLRIVGAMAGG